MPRPPCLGRGGAPAGSSGRAAGIIRAGDISTATAIGLGAHAVLSTSAAGAEGRSAAAGAIDTASAANAAIVTRLPVSAGRLAALAGCVCGSVPVRQSLPCAQVSSQAPLLHLRGQARGKLSSVQRGDRAARVGCPGSHISVATGVASDGLCEGGFYRAPPRCSAWTGSSRHSGARLALQQGLTQRASAQRRGRGYGSTRATLHRDQLRTAAA